MRLARDHRESGPEEGRGASRRGSLAYEIAVFLEGGAADVVDSNLAAATTGLSAARDDPAHWGEDNPNRLNYGTTSRHLAVLTQTERAPRRGLRPSQWPVRADARVG